ncbi:MAG: O-antigen ligase family protein [Thermodesulfobacteriota bacterium]
MLLLSGNPIPAGALVILLFVGPFLLFRDSRRRVRILHVFVVIFGILVIFLIAKRGPILALLIMSLLAAGFLPGKKMWIIPFLVVLLIGTGYMMRGQLPRTLTKRLIADTSILFRLENYSLAFHIFLKKPFFGTGLHVPLQHHLEDYGQKVTQNKRYSRFIKEKKTFENMLLCLFVEMGGLFAAAYIALMVYLLRNLSRSVRDNHKLRLQAILFLLPLTGFFVHSMTFDSLIYPHLNWLFHSYLGLMANFSEMS